MRLTLALLVLAALVPAPGCRHGRSAAQTTPAQRYYTLSLAARDTDRFCVLVPPAPNDVPLHCISVGEVRHYLALPRSNADDASQH